MKMKKKLTYIVATALFAGVLITGCGKDAGKTTEVTEQAEQTEDKSDKADYKNYESADGWSVKYNSNLIEVNESSEMVSFVYSGESAGTNMVEVSYIKDKQPKEVLSEQLAETGNDEAMGNITEGYLGSGEDVWCYRADTSVDTEGTGINESFIVAEYNGGVLYFHRTGHNSGNDEIDMAVSDTMAEIIDSLELKDFQGQKEFSYIPGEYKLSADAKNSAFDTIALNDNHTGTMVGKDGSVNIMWHSAKLVETESGKEYEYSVEGSNLYVSLNGEFVEFVKGDAAKTEDKKTEEKKDKKEKSDDKAKEEKTEEENTEATSSDNTSTGNTYAAATLAPDDKVEAFAQSVIDTVKAKDWSKLADMMKYPATINGSSVDSKDAFMALINEKGASEVFVSSVSGLTSKDIFANGQGIAIGNGDVWFVDDGFTGLDQIGDPDFKIITLNGIIAE